MTHLEKYPKTGKTGTILFRQVPMCLHCEKVKEVTGPSMERLHSGTRCWEGSSPQKHKEVFGSVYIWRKQDSAYGNEGPGQGVGTWGQG